MPVRRRFAKKRPARPVARKGRKGARKGRSQSGGKQMAKIVETLEFVDINSDTVYNFNFNLSQFDRASVLAPNFKYYKAAKVTWNMEALYNTFQEANGGTGITQPYLYTTMNRTQDTTGQVVADLQAMGAKPIKFTGKHSISYRPNWCSPGLSVLTYTGGTGLPPVNTNSQGLKSQYGYLACPTNNPGHGNTSAYTPANSQAPPSGGFILPNAINTNQVIYNGHTIFVDQLVPPSAPLTVARVTCTVEWHFKDPHYTNAPRETVNAQPAKALLNASALESIPTV